MARAVRHRRPPDAHPHRQGHRRCVPAGWARDAGAGGPGCHRRRIAGRSRDGRLMAAAPQDAEDLYMLAQRDPASPSREKALKWVFGASHYLKLKIEMQARADSCDAKGRAAAIRGDAEGADAMGACSSMVGTASQLHA